MKKILMRAAMLPLNELDTFQIIAEDRIGTNAGNLFFPYSLSRTLMRDSSVQIDSILTKYKYSEERIREINEQYDCFVIPLANAFRISFVKELNFITDLVKRLKIPCIVVGVGLQTGVDARANQSYAIDESVKKFVKAILDKSDKLGVRGQITADYLKHLGFKEDRDFTVIGCPSMFLFGDQLPQITKKELKPDSFVCINRKIGIPLYLHAFLEKCQIEFSNYCFIPQNTFDLRLLYGGVPLDMDQDRNTPPNYPQHYLDACFKEDKVRGFVNVPSWLDFMKQATFNFGSRIHGNIAGILAGIPSYIFVSDSRILELADYHNIPHMLARDIDQNTNIYDIYEHTDFNLVHKGHKERFEHYLDFLQKNGLKTVYDGDRRRDEVYFDREMRKQKLQPPIKPFILETPEEQMRRTEQYYKYLYESLAVENKELKQRLNKEQKHLINKIIRRLRGLHGAKN
ncbi:polysaccharide pyruvyl transferase family protein [Ihubacter massiliensis]|uniref:Polysaccharide pyruvyl transferase family protein n=1 Tax=Hominibacterium faecale TaxID=2839743 RepID=A0A9J6QRK1_9FIRM|nr:MULTISPECIES: polysaccharide pyruvyl transferase family protein [Eubacteriales Family XIII. Incertae Sedis]MCO7123773.1 polysaccharide pyruvyl transferase family protein [Ihubacter massiliensis]MCU7378698.1 polysaccharide pyruvyl transferase family protein [Hominibacterium faecale]